MANEVKAGIQLEFCDLTSSGIGECGGRAFEVLPSDSIEPGDTVTFNVYGAKSKMLSGLKLQRGTRLLKSSSVVANNQEVEETLSFVGVEKIQLKYPYQRILVDSDTRYVGAYKDNKVLCWALTDIMQQDNVTGVLSLYAAAGSRILLDLIGYSCVGTTDTIKLYGTIKIKYLIAGYKISWQWVVPVTTGDFYFYLLQDSILLYNHMISIDASGYITSPVDVVVVVREYTTDALIAGAAVEINGDYVGETDENGRINIGSKPVGRYTIKITKSGYVDTDLDDLENDSFIVGGT